MGLSKRASGASNCRNDENGYEKPPRHKSSTHFDHLARIQYDDSIAVRYRLKSMCDGDELEGRLAMTPKENFA